MQEEQKVEAMAIVQKVPAMSKPYDIKALLEMSKDDGLELAEEEAKQLIANIFAWLQASAEQSETPYDDMAVALHPVVKKFLLDNAEKINKKDNAVV